MCNALSTAYNAVRAAAAPREDNINLSAVMDLLSVNSAANNADLAYNHGFSLTRSTPYFWRVVEFAMLFCVSVSICSFCGWQFHSLRLPRTVTPAGKTRKSAKYMPAKQRHLLLYIFCCAARMVYRLARARRRGLHSFTPSSHALHALSHISVRFLAAAPRMVLRFCGSHQNISISPLPRAPSRGTRFCIPAAPCLFTRGSCCITIFHLRRKDARVTADKSESGLRRRAVGVMTTGARRS